MAWPLPRPSARASSTPMALSGPEVHAMSPEGVGVSRRPHGRVAVFSPTFDPATELGSGRLGQRLLRFSTDVSEAINDLGESVDTVHSRLVGVESAQRCLAEGATRALEEI